MNEERARVHRGVRYDSGMSDAIIPLHGDLPAETSEVAAERLLSGAPRTQIANYFSDTTQQFFAGFWSATQGKWRIRYTENELCVMTAGRVVLHNDAGERWEFAAGDAFVVPAGFSGTWEVLENCIKIYAVFEPQA